jgi:biopolymer transport protein ExbD
MKKYILSILISLLALFSAQANSLPPQLNITISIKENGGIEYQILGRSYETLQHSKNLMTAYMKASPDTYLIIRTSKETPIHEIDKLVTFLKDYNVRHAYLIVGKSTEKRSLISIEMTNQPFRERDFPLPTR